MHQFALEYEQAERQALLAEGILNPEYVLEGLYDGPAVILTETILH